MSDFKNMTFNEAMSQLEENINILEKNPNDDKLLQETIALKDYCADLLKKDKAEIIKLAQENNISLEELGLSLEEDEQYDKTDNNK